MDEDFQMKDCVESIRVLNYTNEETVDYPFVLLECEIEKAFSLKQRTEHNSAVEEYGTTSLQHDFVLVTNAEECRSWPVVHGGFKALIQLINGENVIKLKASISGTFVENEFKLTYEPSTLTRFETFRP